MLPSFFCPYLGKSEDRDTVVGFPHDTNNCFASGNGLPIDKMHQSKYCLITNFQHCKVFQSKPVPNAVPPTDEPYSPTVAPTTQISTMPVPPPPPAAAPVQTAAEQGKEKDTTQPVRKSSRQSQTDLLTQQVAAAEKPKPTPATITPPMPVNGSNRRAVPPRPARNPALAAISESIAKNYGPQASYGPQPLKSYGPQTLSHTGMQRAYGAQAAPLPQTAAPQQQPPQPVVMQPVGYAPAANVVAQAPVPAENGAYPANWHEWTENNGGNKPVADAKKAKPVGWLKTFEVVMAILLFAGLGLLVWLVINVIPKLSGG